MEGVLPCRLWLESGGYVEGVLPCRLWLESGGYVEGVLPCRLWLESGGYVEGVLPCRLWLESGGYVEGVLPCRLCDRSLGRQYGEVRDGGQWVACHAYVEVVYDSVDWETRCSAVRQVSTMHHTWRGRLALHPRERNTPVPIQAATVPTSLIPQVTVFMEPPIATAASSEAPKQLPVTQLVLGGGRQNATVNALAFRCGSGTPVYAAVEDTYISGGLGACRAMQGGRPNSNAVSDPPWLDPFRVPDPNRTPTLSGPSPQPTPPAPTASCLLPPWRTKRWCCSRWGVGCWSGDGRGGDACCNMSVLVGGRKGLGRTRGHAKA